MRKAIAMKCNKEQFEAVKGKLEGMKFHSDLYSFFTHTKHYYLTNNYNQKEEISSTLSPECHKEIHETWNEKVFLEACGIEPIFTITKETIMKYEMKDEFPSVFKKEFEVGKWYYQTDSKALINYQGGSKGYGFEHNKTWNDLIGCWSFESHAHEWIEATEQEVFEALKNEAVKRGFKEVVYVNNSNIYDSKFKNYCMEKGIIKYSNKELILYISKSEHYCFFRDGVWAEIIPTLTKKEAEEKLNCKIV